MSPSPQSPNAQCHWLFISVLKSMISSFWNPHSSRVGSLKTSSYWFLWVQELRLESRIAEVSSPCSLCPVIWDHERTRTPMGHAGEALLPRGARKALAKPVVLLKTASQSSPTSDPRELTRWGMRFFSKVQRSGTTRRNLLLCCACEERQSLFFFFKYLGQRRSWDLSKFQVDLSYRSVLNYVPMTQGSYILAINQCISNCSNNYPSCSNSPSMTRRLSSRASPSAQVWHPKERNWSYFIMFVLETIWMSKFKRARWVFQCSGPCGSISRSQIHFSEPQPTVTPWALPRTE